jgi:hypothetical protein
MAEDNEQTGPEGSQVFSVRLPSSGAAIADNLVQLHYKMKHLPEATRSEYLKYLITRDAEAIRDSIKTRRAKIAA